MIDKIVNHKHVYISTEEQIQSLIEYYYRLNLIETGEDIHSYYFSFIHRKSMNLSLKTKLVKL